MESRRDKQRKKRDRKSRDVGVAYRQTQGKTPGRDTERRQGRAEVTETGRRDERGRTAEGDDGIKEEQ